MAVNAQLKPTLERDTREGRHHFVDWSIRRVTKWDKPPTPECGEAAIADCRRSPSWPQLVAPLLHGARQEVQRAQQPVVCAIGWRL